MTKIRAETVEALNGKRMESEKQPGNILRRKYNKIWTKKLAQNLKEGKDIGKIDTLNRRTNENENKMIGNNVGQDGEDDGVTREAQQQKCENAMPTDNMTPNNDGNGEKQHQRQEQDLD